MDHPVPDTPSTPPSPTAARAPVLLVVAGSLLAAASMFLLPALDAALPGGSLWWQVGAGALALAGALRVWRRVGAAAPGALPHGRPARVLATVAALLVLLWLAGVGILWLLWPR